jgi:galactonate dehydratase
LPKDTLAARCDLALAWKDRGFHSFKFALPVADEGAAPELRALRSTLGPKAKIAADLHWSLGRNSAVSLALELSPDQPWFLEAPVPTEEIEDLRFVAEHSGQKIAVGEEWRTAYDARLRLKPKACHIVQPEMGHTGITEFLRIAQLAETNGTEVIPHATIGSGIFLAASLQASSALPGVTAHEFQHSIFEPFGSFTGEAMRCDAGFYHLPRKPGIGVEPSEEMWSKMTPIHP